MKVKVCGMKHNIGEVANLKPDYLGFIFWEGSPRYFNGIIPSLASNIRKVGVFVDTSIQHILQKIDAYDLQAVQLHGRETPAFCEALRAALRAYHTQNRKIEIIKVFPIKDQFDFADLQPFENLCDYFLFDSKGKLPGGNGFAFDWHLLEGYPSLKPYFLSGGIGLADRAQLVEFFKRPEAGYCRVLDVNSRFESAAGLKEVAPLKEFIKWAGTINTNTI